MNERELEMAEKFQEDQLARSIKAAANAPMMPAKGECYNCEAPLLEGVKFCDHFCEEDWTRRRQLAKNAPYVAPGEY